MSRVTVQDTTLTLTTYLIGPEDPNPPYQRQGTWAIYPYSMLDDVGQGCEPRDYRAVVLENEYVRVTILPELGGRLHSLYDKHTGREAFYCNQVVKPGLVAQRGAWLAGGIEWNYPAGHHCNTTSPVGCRIEEHPDGSATCWVGALEHGTRVKWLVGIRLEPGCSWVETSVRILNRTPLRGRLYFWENSAVRAPEDLKLVYPARKVLLAGGGERETYPLTKDGRDISLYRNHRLWNDIFCLGTKDDFFGCYYPGEDLGVIHCADPREVTGKKFFTWGTAPSGLMWADILSDEDGPYCEIQGGRFQTQSVWEFLPPNRGESWEQYWWPVHSIGGFQWASLDAALRLEPGEGTVTVGVCVTRPIEEARVALYAGEELVWSWSGGLDPTRPLLEAVPFTGTPEGLRVVLEEGDDELLSYAYGHEPEVNEASLEQVLDAMAPVTGTTARDLLKAGVGCERRGDFLAARSHYERCVGADATIPEAHVGLASVSLRAGLAEEAAEHARAALALSLDDVAARYHLGLALRALGQTAEAEDQLWQTVRSPEWEGPSIVALAEIAFAAGRPTTEVAQLLGLALRRDSTNTRVWCLLAALWRHADEAGVAAEIVGQADLADPTDSLASLERWLQEETDEVASAVLTCTRGLPQDYLEAAWDYAAVGLDLDALRVVDLALLHSPGTPEPLCVPYTPATHAMLGYTRAYLLHRTGRVDEALLVLAEARGLPSEGVFPHRLEEVAVLEWALTVESADARAHLYLGNLLYHLGRKEEARGHWRTAVAGDASLAIAHRNLGFDAWKRGGLPEAADHYSRAIAAKPSDYRYHRDRDEILRALHTGAAERLAALERAPSDVQDRQDIAWRRAALATVLGRYDEAMALLEAHTFRPWEGAVQMRRIYTDVLVARGRQRLAAGDLAGAHADFEQSLTYPLNIGVGQLPMPNEARELYWAARVRLDMGCPEGSRDLVTRALAETHAPASEGRYYQVRAMGLLAELEGKPSAEEIAAATGEMLAACEEATTSRPEDAQAWLALGLARTLGGDAPAAREALTRALELDPQLVEAVVGLA